MTKRSPRERTVIRRCVERSDFYGLDRGHAAAPARRMEKSTVCRQRSAARSRRSANADARDAEGDDAMRCSW